jgi:hypothetical protein
VKFDLSFCPPVYSTYRVSRAAPRGGTPASSHSARVRGRLAQLVRAPALQAGGRRFESCTAHHYPSLSGMPARRGLSPSGVRSAVVDVQACRQPCPHARLHLAPPSAAAALRHIVLSQRRRTTLPSPVLPDSHSARATRAPVSRRDIQPSESCKFQYVKSDYLYASASGTEVSGTAGAITSTSTTSRQIQFGLKLIW